MWKRLSDEVSLSGKLAKLSWRTLAVWLYLLPNTDAQGRYSAEGDVILGRCMTRRKDITPEQIEEELRVLDAERVLHLYDHGGRRFLVLHDHKVWNPPGALRYSESKCPPPPPSVCRCVSGPEQGQNKTIVSSLSTSPSEDEEIAAIVDHLIERQAMPNSTAAVLKWVRALVRRGFMTVLRVWANNPQNAGKDVIAMAEDIDPRNGKHAPVVRVNQPTKKADATKSCRECLGVGAVVKERPVPGKTTSAGKQAVETWAEPCACVRTVTA